MLNFSVDHLQGNYERLLYQAHLHKIIKVLVQ